MATSLATANIFLDVVIFIFALFILIRVVRSASRFKSGDTGILFKSLRSGFIMFFLFTLLLGVGSTLAYFEISPAFMSTGETFEMMILIAHILLIISLILLIIFAKRFERFSEQYSFGK